MQFLNSGQKIYELRKRLRMPQQEFVCDKISKSYFSMLENGTRRLNKNIAELITRKLMERAEELGVDLDIDENYLLKTKEEEAMEYCQKLLDNNESLEMLEEAGTVAEKYGLLEMEALALKAKGDFYYTKQDYSNAFINYCNVLNLYSKCIDEKHFPIIYNRIGICKSKEIKFKEAGFYFDKAYEHANINKDTLLMRDVLLNKAINCKKIKNYDKSIEFINEYIALWDGKSNVDGYVYAQSLKANCCQMLGDHEETIRIYEDLVQGKYTQKDSMLAFLYNNLGSSYLEVNDFEKSLLNFNKSQNLRETADRYNLPHTLVDKAELYKRQNMYNEANNILDKAVDMLKENDDRTYLIKAYKLCSGICELNSDLDGLEQNCFKILDVLRGADDFAERLEVYFKLVELYIKQDNKIEACKYLNIIQKMTKNLNANGV